MHYLSFGFATSSGPARPVHERTSAGKVQSYTPNPARRCNACLILVAWRGHTAGALQGPLPVACTLDLCHGPNHQHCSPQITPPVVQTRHTSKDVPACSIPGVAKRTIGPGLSSRARSKVLICLNSARHCTKGAMPWPRLRHARLIGTPNAPGRGKQHEHGGMVLRQSRAYAWPVAQ